jgi:hypothetical protein
MMEKGMERSEIAAEGTIKKGLHKTPTTEFVPQLFDASCHPSGFAVLILHESQGDRSDFRRLGAKGNRD